MPLTALAYALWIVGTVLELSLAILVIRRRLYTYLPLFSTYILLIVTRELTWWGVVHTLGYQSRPTFYFAWATQGVVLCARGLAIAELCLRILRPYAGIWGIGWRILLVVGSGVLLYAAVDVRGHASLPAHFILSAERGLELAAAAALITLLLFSTYYGIRLQPVERLLVLGLAFYSTVQVFNNSVLQQWLGQYFVWWREVRQITYYVAVGMWLAALRRPLPVGAPAPELLPQHVYEELAPQLNYRLQHLNERLLEILKS